MEAKSKGTKWEPTPVVQQKERFADAFLISFVEKVYGKACSEVSEEELAQLTAELKVTDHCR